MGRKSAGYSLFEVLVAFIIMALVLSVLIPAQTRFLARADDGASKVLAYDLALSHLAKIGISEPIEVGIVERDTAHWQLTLITSEITDELAHVVATVSDSRGRVLAEVTHMKSTR